MDITTVMTTLQGLSAFAGRVTVATDLPSALEAVKPFAAMPCCVVHGLAERAGDDQLATGGPRQKVAVSLKLLIVHRDVTDPHGAAAMAGITAARDAVLAALQGLVPDTGYSELLLNSGQLAYAQAGTVAWLDDWKTSYQLSAN